MTKTEFVNGLTRTANKINLGFQKNLPGILVVTGLAAGLATVVTACKATTKASAIVDEAKAKLDDIHEAQELAKKDPEVAKKYSEQDMKKDLATTYINAGVKFAKLYGPSIILGVTSVACILGGYKIIKGRAAAVAAAYTALDHGFRNYRKNVVERFGDEVDRELRHNIKAETIEEVITNEDGTEVVVEKVEQVARPGNYSPYSIVYMEGNKGWTGDPEDHKFFLLQMQNWANERLKARGVLFLNEVFESLGAPLTKAGAVVGWIYDPKDPTRDNYVDFGIFDITKPKACDFVNGYEKAIVLDFNVDGNVAELLV